MSKIKDYFFPEEIEGLAKKIQEKGGELFLVGGSLRDILLGIKPAEYDFEIHASKEAKILHKSRTKEEQEKESLLFLKEMGLLLGDLGPLQELGKSFGILKIKGKAYDFSFPRKERKEGEKRQDFAIEIDPFLDLKEAQKRRDFTINSLAYSFKDKLIVDNFSALADLESKTIRITDSATFPEDPLRVYRLAQFISRLGFGVDLPAREICRQMDLSNLSLERIEMEMEKLFRGHYISQAFIFLKESQALKKRHPLLDELFTAHPDKLASLNEISPYLDKESSFQENFLFFLMHFSKKDKCLLSCKEIAELLDSFSRNLRANKVCLANLKELFLLRDFVDGKTGYEEALYKLTQGQSANKGDILAYYSFWQEPSQELTILIEEREKFKALISGQDLLEEGLMASENFKVLLDKAKKLQIAGKKKDQILKILREEEKNGL